MDPEFFRTLFAYNDWADGQVMDLAARLSAEAYSRDFGQAWGSVRGTLVHLMSADRVWLDRWQGKPATLTHDVDLYPTVDVLRPAWEAVMAERRAFVGGLSADDLRAPLVYRNSQGKEFNMPLWQPLFQAANHAADHRGHVSVMLSDLGQPPVQALDFIAWVRLQG